MSQSQTQRICCGQSVGEPGDSEKPSAYTEHPAPKSGLRLKKSQNSGRAKKSDSFFKDSPLAKLFDLFIKTVKD